MKRNTAYNSTCPKGGVSFSKDSFEVNGSLVFHPDNYRDKFCGKSPAFRVAANRYAATTFVSGQFYQYN